jgi:hypothetical protein
MKAKLTDEASKSALAKLSGWSDVAGNDVASRVIRMSFSHRCAPLGPTPSGQRRMPGAMTAINFRIVFAGCRCKLRAAGGQCA